MGAVLPQSVRRSSDDSEQVAPDSRRVDDHGVDRTDRASSWITPRQAAAYLGVGVDTIYEACAAADLKHVKLGYRTIRLRREWIDIWAEKHATPAR
ncbi:MAG: helix-turn-helix domain-containing protein [Vicinamibacterales bacterium]